MIWGIKPLPPGFCQSWQANFQFASSSWIGNNVSRAHRPQDNSRPGRVFVLSLQIVCVEWSFNAGLSLSRSLVTAFHFLVWHYNDTCKRWRGGGAGGGTRDLGGGMWDRIILRKTASQPEWCTDTQGWLCSHLFIQFVLTLSVCN